MANEPKGSAAPVDPAAVVSAWLDRSPGSPVEVRERYRADMTHALTTMPAPTRGKAIAAIDGGRITFYPDRKSFIAALSAITGRGERKTAGLVIHRDDGVEVHFNGGKDTRGTYMHELWHVVDGRRRFSGMKG